MRYRTLSLSAGWVFFRSLSLSLFPRLQDLEQYATSYSGLMRIERLQFIAEHCPQLRVEALKMALTFVQRTFNVDTYEEIHRKLTEATRYARQHADLTTDYVTSVAVYRC